MKKLTVFLLAILAAFLLAACVPESEPIYEVERGGVIFTVDTVNQTITADGHTYGYQISGGSTTITYPNGATYYWSWSGNVGSGGWGEGYDPETYVDGDILLDVLNQGTPQKESGGNPLLGLLLIALGIWHAASPYTAWYLSHGWRYKNAEPSDLALGMTRVGGFVVIVAGIILFFV